MVNIKFIKFKLLFIDYLRKSTSYKISSAGDNKKYTIKTQGMPERPKTTTKRDIHINTTKIRAGTANVHSGGKPKERLPLRPSMEIKMVLFFALGMVKVQKMIDPNSNTRQNPLQDDSKVARPKSC